MKDKLHCFECSNGTYDNLLMPYETVINGIYMTVPSVPHMVCNWCGDEVISSAASRMIEEFRIANGAVYGRSPRRIKDGGNDK